MADDVRRVRGPRHPGPGGWSAPCRRPGDGLARRPGDRTRWRDEEPVGHSRTAALLLAAVAAVAVMAPWMARNLATFGSAFPSAGGRAVDHQLQQQVYDELKPNLPGLVPRLGPGQHHRFQARRPGGRSAGGPSCSWAGYSVLLLPWQSGHRPPVPGRGWSSRPSAIAVRVHVDGIHNALTPAGRGICSADHEEAWRT